MGSGKHLRFKKLKYQIDQFEQKLNKEQRETDRLIRDKTLTIVSGKAGSGKTLVACFTALKKFAYRKIDKIVITRPTVSTEDNGFLPGDINEKLDPWMAPIYSCIETILKPINPHNGGNTNELFEQLMSENVIEIVPLTYMRGRTFTNSSVIVDECQNLTMEQSMMCISRIGVYSNMVMCGDIAQVDLRYKKDSGMVFLSNLDLRSEIGSIELKENHRHVVVDQILEEYEKFKKRTEDTDGKVLYMNTKDSKAI